MSAGDLGRAIGAGRIDPVALTERFIQAIADHPHSRRIYARTTIERALAEAGAAHQRARDGARLGLLDGVPVSWKDLFDSAGTATEAGSALISGRVPKRDAVVLANATAAGLVCLGKTHMSELAFSGLGLNPVTATPPCVNDESAVSGGSTSGGAASVAYGLAAAAVGSDTGGSVRIPAAWNDLVGMKTTSGRLPLTGVVPLAARFDTVGPLTRTVEDAALMLAALEGRKPADLRGASLRGMRFMTLKTVAMEGLRGAPRAAFQSAVERLQAAGAIVKTLEAPEVAQAMDLAAILFTVEAYGTWKTRIEAAPDRMFPMIRERFRSGGQFSGADYVAAWRRLDTLRAQWAARVAGFDAVLVPTSPILPPNADRLMTDPEYYVAENLLALRNTRIGNLMDCACLTLPTGVPSTGISFMAPPMAEERLLRIGAAAEAALA
ncbi:amidase [Actibacterium sp.]|uniref:amidase n=1 Tax=Actibacterium sp. TaxID=1872125 RepID=UPI003563857C